MNRSQNTRGFTLVEICISTLLTGIVSMVVYTVYASSQKSYTINTTTVELRQNLRASLDFISGELMTAGNSGYDFTSNSVGLSETGIVSALKNSIIFTHDSDADGNITTSAYGLSAGSDADGDGVVDNADGTALLQRTLNLDPPDTVTDDIQAIQFAYAYDDNSDRQLDYIDANGNSLPETNETIWAYDGDDDGLLDTRVDGTALATGVNVDKIRLVRIWLLGRSERTLKSTIDSNTYSMGSVSVSGNNDQYKRFLLTTTVKLRNMGL